MTSKSSVAALLLLSLALTSAQAQEPERTIAQFDAALGAASTAFMEPMRIELLEDDGERIVLHWQQGSYREELSWLGFSEVFASDGSQHWYGSTMKLPYALNGGVPPRITLELCKAFAFLQPQWRGYLEPSDPAAANSLMFSPPLMSQALLTLENDGDLTVRIGDKQLLAESSSFTLTQFIGFNQYGEIKYASTFTTDSLDIEGNVLRSVRSKVVAVDNASALDDAQFSISSAPEVPTPVLPTVPYTIEFELKSGAVILPLTTSDGTTLRLQFDTGASAGLLRRDVAARFGLTAVGTEQVRGHGSVVNVSYTRVEGLRLGEAIVPPFAAAVMEEGNGLDRRLGQSAIDGLIGNFLLQSYVVRIDYPRRKLTLWPRDGFDPEQLRNTFTAVLHREMLPWSDVVVDGKIRGGAYFNTGASYPFALSYWACDDAGIAYPVDSMERAVSVGGSSMFGIIRPGEVKLLGTGRSSDLVINGPPTALELLSPGEPMERYRMASFGSAMLKDYAVTFDLQRERIYLSR
ncbi:MAG: retropepsin-like domain-containing protein [bacterium]|nr:retropepsin-like domain-containing protein [bacterium]